jgi:hypothetical protein
MKNYKRKSKRWSPREDALLASGVENETPYEEIGGQIGRTASSVAQRIYYLRKNTTAIPPLNKEKPQRAVRRVEPVIKASEPEIKAIADDNRIWLAMAGGLTSAVCSFSTFLIVLLALLS